MSRELVGALNALAGTVGEESAGAANAAVERFASYPAHAYQQVDADITLTDVNRIVGCTTSDITVTLPDDVPAGSWLIVKDESGQAGSIGQAITLTPASGTVDGAAQLMLNQDYEGVLVYFDGSSWFTGSAVGGVL